MAELSENVKNRVSGGVAILEKMQEESNDELLKKSQETRGNYLAVLEGLSREQWEFSPGEGKWSIKEVCLHVSFSVRNCAKRSMSLADGAFPTENEEVRMGMQDENTDDHELVGQRVREAFDAADACIKHLNEGSDLEKVLPHPFFGPLNCRGWAAFNIMHAGYHVGQMNRVKEAGGYPA